MKRHTDLCVSVSEDKQRLMTNGHNFFSELTLEADFHQTMKNIQRETVDVPVN